MLCTPCSLIRFEAKRYSSSLLEYTFSTENSTVTSAQVIPQLLISTSSSIVMLLKKEAKAATHHIVGQIQCHQRLEGEVFDD